MRPALLILLLFVLSCSSEDEVKKIASKPQGQTVDPRSRVLLLEAHRALSQRELHETLNLLDQVERYNPNLPEAQFLRGRAWLEMKRFADARAAFQGILKRYPNYEAAWHSLGDVAYAQDKLREALSYYRKEDAINPTPQTWYNIGNVYRRLGQPDSAFGAYQRSIKLEGTYAPAFYALAELDVERDRTDAALKSARESFRLQPGNVEYAYLVGSLLFQKGDLVEAETILRQTAERFPWHHSTLYTLGQVLQQAGKGDEAASFYAQAEDARVREAEIRQITRDARRHADSSLAQIALAEEFIRAGRPDDALQHFQVALALDPDNLTIKQNIASLSLARGEVDKALRLCEEIVRSDSLRVGSWVIMSAAHARKGNHAASAEAWARAMRIDPDHPSIRQVLSKN